MFRSIKLIAPLSRQQELIDLLKPVTFRKNQCDYDNKLLVMEFIGTVSCPGARIRNKARKDIYFRAITIIETS